MILKEVRNNKISSFFIVSIFVIFVTLIIYYICTAFELGVFSIVIALLFSISSALISYYTCDKLVLTLNGARPATELQDKLLSSTLDNLCIASGLPKPKLYVIEDQAKNAFATGRNPNTAVICVTTGLLESLDKYELEGVLAHELAHVKNYDILLSTIVSVFVGLVVMLSDFIWRISFFKDSDDDDKLGIIAKLIGLVLLILSPIFATLMQLAISRKREFLADSTSVEFTRNPEGLISALKKISIDTTVLKTANKATAHLYISDPLKKKETSFFSTHPSIDDRIMRLQNIQ